VAPSLGIKRSSLYVVLVLAVLATYGRIVSHDFVAWDDDGHITDNPHLDPVSWQGLVRLWREPYFSHYVPVSYTMFAGEAWLAQSHRDEFGKLQFRPIVFHTVSLLLHLACTLLVFGLLARILDHPLAACAGALLFALHPLQVESVAWISEQRGLLCGVFSLLAILSYLRFGAGIPRNRNELYPWQRPAVEAATGGIGNYALATVACLLAILAKPSGAAVPLMAGAMDLFLLRRAWRVSLAALLPWLVMAWGMFLITSGEQPGEALYFLPPKWARPLIAADALQFYLTKLIWPAGLIIQYPRAPRLVLADSWVYLAWIVPAAVLLACYCGRKHGPWLAAAGWFLTGLAPVLGLVPFGYQWASTVADRYCYLAMASLALVLAWWIKSNPTPPRIALAAAALLVWGALSFQQAGHWRDSDALFAHTLRINPKSSVAHSNWAGVLLRRGEYQQALNHLEEAFRLSPWTANEKLYLNRGLALLGLGRVDDAIQAYEETLVRYPGSHLAHLNLSGIYPERQDYAKTIEHSRAALIGDPSSFPARFNLALALERQSRPKEAIAELRTLLDHAPGQFEAHMKLASILQKQGETQEAMKHFGLGVKSRPDDSVARLDYALALADAGQRETALAELRRLLRQPGADGPLVAAHAAWTLATDPSATAAARQEARMLAEAACRQTQFKDPLALRALAAAQAAGGDFSAAAKTAQDAQALAQAAGNQPLVAALGADADTYRSGKVLRDPPPLAP
jgi:tetratricopeptide (TPR) repeat protein